MTELHGVTIYHNPQCSKSRATLELLRESGLDVDVVEYLKVPPDKHKISQLLAKLQLVPRELIRQQNYEKLGLPPTDDPDELIDRMVEHPQIIQRPIVETRKAARIGRPPESVLEILPRV